MLIGLFDSGIGGISVLHEALKIMPEADYLYYADTKNVPYGTKAKHEVKKFVLDAAEFMHLKQISALVVACNTATSVAIDDLRRIYDYPIIGMEPAVKPAVESNGSKRILVTATPLTLEEEKLKNLISKLDNEHMVDLLPLPGLVDFAEKLEFREEIILPYFKSVFSEYDMDKYSTVVLGCTHYVFYRPLLRKILPEKINIIDGNAGTVRYLKKQLEERKIPIEGSGRITYCSSGAIVSDKSALKKYGELLKRLD